MKWILFFSWVAQVWGLSTTVIIPCVASHFHYLEPLLQAYAAQTKLPDEIVIALCQVECLEEGAVAALESRPWPFALKILCYLGRQSAGVNRNLACEVASGALLLCQDADDLPHPQRVEIVNYLFTRHRLEHLIHGWLSEEEAIPVFRSDLLPLNKFRAFDDITRFYSLETPRARFQPHYGNVCLLAEVAKKVKWENSLEFDRDVAFNQKVYAAFTQLGATPSPLVIYRQHLSAYTGKP